MSLNIEKFLDVEKELRAFKLSKPKGFQTRALHFAQEAEQWSSRATVPPIHTSSTYALEDQRDYGYFYLRVASPSRDVLQRCFANLDDAKYCFTFPSGNSATMILFELLKPGDNLILSRHLYGGTYSLAKNCFAIKEIELDVVDFTDINALKQSIKPNTKMVFFESLTNPTLRVIDIKAVVDTVRSIRKDILIVVDNTYLTPYLQRPLTFGVDVAMYSFTKYVNGHSDVLMGALTFNDESLYQTLRMMQIRLGSIPSPFDCYLVTRSLKTLSMRMDVHFRNSIIVAKFLESHLAVEKVHHPALKSHPDHELALRQASGHNGMVTFWLKSPKLQDNEDLMKKFKVIVLSGSLGGVVSSINTPIVLTAGPQPRFCKEDIEITDNLVRFSVGTEDPEDLIEDLNQALNSLL